MARHNDVNRPYILKLNHKTKKNVPKTCEYIRA